MGSPLPLIQGPERITQAIGDAFAYRLCQHLRHRRVPRQLEQTLQTARAAVAISYAVHELSRNARVG